MEQYFRRLSFIKFAGLLVLGLILSVVIAVFIMYSGAQESLAQEMALITFTSSVIMYGAWFLFIWRRSLSSRERDLIRTPAPARSRRNIWFALAALLWSLPVNFIYTIFLERFFPDFLEQMMEAGNLPENLFTTSDPLSLLLMFIPVVILAPIVEEIIFRGVLYNLLNKRMSLPMAALISSVIFGLMHGTTFFQTALIGFVLAFVYQVTGDLKMAMLGHGLNNGVAFFQGVLMEEGFLDQGSMGEVIFAGIMLAGSVTIVILTISYFRKNPIRSIFRDHSPIYKHEIARSQRILEASDQNLSDRCLEGDSL